MIVEAHVEVPPHGDDASTHLDYLDSKNKTIPLLLKGIWPQQCSFTNKVHTHVHV